jgi:hypothetical protein
MRGSHAEHHRECAHDKTCTLTVFFSGLIMSDTHMHSQAVCHIYINVHVSTC